MIDGVGDDPMFLGGMDSDEDLLNASNTTTPSAKSTKVPIKRRAKLIKKNLQKQEIKCYEESGFFNCQRKQKRKN